MLMSPPRWSLRYQLKEDQQSGESGTMKTSEAQGGEALEAAMRSDHERSH